MLTKSLLWLEKVVGVLLGGLAVGTQMANVLVCVLLIALGPSFVAGLMYV